MSTLLLRLAAPLQSWGLESKFDTRQTGREPTKSGIIGLLACALGVARDDQAALVELNTLSVAIREDQEGQLLRDYHTVKSYKSPMDLIACADPEDAYQTYRYYLADAVFVVAVSSENEELLQRLEQALKAPAFPLYLGRRSCPPTLPVVLGLKELPLLEAVQSEPWQAAQWYRKKQQRQSGTETVRLRIVLDHTGQGGVAMRDVPHSFDPHWRRYGFRNVTETYAVIRNAPMEHDAMAEVEACT